MDTKNINVIWENIHHVLNNEICCNNPCETCPLCDKDGICFNIKFTTMLKEISDNIKQQFEAADRNPNPLITPPAEDGTAENAIHYKQTAVQPIELMQYTLSREELIGFLKGNIMKYTIRAGKKGNETEKDNKKAAQYRLWLDNIQEGRRIIV